MDGTKPHDESCVTDLFTQIIFMEPSGTGIDDVADWVLTLAVPNSVHRVVQAFLVKRAEHLV